MSSAIDETLLHDRVRLYFKVLFLVEVGMNVMAGILDAIGFTPPQESAAHLAILSVRGGAMAVSGLGWFWCARSRPRRVALVTAETAATVVLAAKLGSGGMGEVYEATHVLLRRPAAVKLLPPDKAGAQTLARFEREVSGGAKVTHESTIVGTPHLPRAGDDPRGGRGGAGVGRLRARRRRLFPPHRARGLRGRERDRGVLQAPERGARAAVVRARRRRPGARTRGAPLPRQGIRPTASPTAPRSPRRSPGCASTDGAPPKRRRGGPSTGTKRRRRRRSARGARPSSTSTSPRGRTDGQARPRLLVSDAPSTRRKGA